MSFPSRKMVENLTTEEYHLRSRSPTDRREEDGEEPTTRLSDLIEETSDQEKSPKEKYSYVIGVKDREEIARAAYKIWFRIKPGNKEIKDRWWALYYKHILPKFHLRDNHLGRKINSWIEQDLKALEKNNTARNVSLLSDNTESQITLSHSELIDSSVLSEKKTEPKPPKKRKPNSSKEGTIPAYLNVELVHPPEELIHLQVNKEDIVEDSPEYFALKLREHSIDSNIDWDEFQLDKDVAWFRENRTSIMEKIPSLSGPRKQTMPGSVKAPKKKMKSEPSSEWINMDVYKNEDSLIVKLDLPGLLPNQDFQITSDGYKLLIKGERKIEEEGLTLIQHSRPGGPFQVEIPLPQEADMMASEQTFSNGVLTIRFPLREKDTNWRTLPVNFVD